MLVCLQVVTDSSSSINEFYAITGCIIIADVDIGG
nr:MAG TPA: hypothetical protein [Caudoviricetes sp.]